MGPCLVGAAFVALGFGAASALSARATALGEAARALALLSRRVSLLYEPIADAVYALRDESPLLALAAEGHEHEPSAAFRNAFKRTRSLREGDAAIFLETLRCAGAASREEQPRVYAAGIDLLKTREDAANARARSDAKLYRTLGLLAAAAVLILSL